MMAEMVVGVGNNDITDTKPQPARDHGGSSATQIITSLHADPVPRADKKAPTGVRWDIPEDHGYESHALDACREWYDPVRKSIITGVSLVEDYEDDDNDYEYYDVYEECDGKKEQKEQREMTKEETSLLVKQLKIVVIVFRLFALVFCVIAITNAADVYIEEKLALKIFALVKVIVGLAGALAVIASKERLTQCYVCTFVIIYLSYMSYPAVSALVLHAKSSRNFIKTWCSLVSDRSCYDRSDQNALFAVVVRSLYIIVFVFLATIITLAFVILLRRQAEYLQKLEKFEEKEEYRYEPDIESPRHEKSPTNKQNVDDEMTSVRE
eukprot:GEMP01064348.1.p1 GENE.GEMP01064348.1~~GEMP01064348.1.p1  ORF type:complete len:324 (+),score=57.86 GEMP01064348.1:242-1213(+)